MTPPIHRTGRSSLTVWSAPIALLSLLLLFDPNAARPPWEIQFPPLRTADIVVGETPLHVELAEDVAAQARGLGYREGLEPGTGMLFVYPAARPATYWMKGMRFCLDIIWIDQGQIIGAAENACPDPDGTADENRARFASNGAVQYVLEVPAGFMAEHGYGAGTPVSGLPAPALPSS